MEINDIERSLGKLEGIMESFISSHNIDIERINQSIKENHTFLKNEVSKTLNSHAEIKNDTLFLRNNYPLLENRVTCLETLTEKMKLMDKDGDVKKGLELWSIIKVIAIIFGGMVIASSGIDALMNIINKI